MDQGIIQDFNKSYRSKLHREYLQCLLQSKTSGNGSTTTKQFLQGRAGVQEGRTAHVSDAIRIANIVLEDVPDNIIANCWKTSTCLGGNGEEGLVKNYNVHNELQKMT